MKTATIATLFVLLVGTACKPSVGAPISLVSGPAILAIKGTPAEVDPKGEESANYVKYEALAVDVNGRVPGPAPGADIAAPLLWATCIAPKPPTESNSVSANCLDTTALPGTVGNSDSTYEAPAPLDACSLFGPKTPPAGDGQPPLRKRDADVTGGYYLPIRVQLLVPENLHRAGMATENSLISFQLQRIYCALADAPLQPIRDYAATYKLNNNPVLSSLTLLQTDPVPMVVPPSGTAGSPLTVTNDQTLSLTANWPVDSTESYPAWDVVSRTLVTHREAMRVSWYATGGTFEHDVTGRGETEPETFAENTWKPDATGLVHMWLVLHDSRGGTDFAAYDFQVTP